MEDMEKRRRRCERQKQYYALHREEICAKARARWNADIVRSRERMNGYKARRRKGEDTSSAWLRELEEIGREERRRGLRPVHDAFKNSACIPLNTIQSARTKPKGVSAARWRMELSRRAMSRKWGKKSLDFLTDPDTIR